MTSSLHSSSASMSKKRAREDQDVALDKSKVRKSSSSSVDDKDDSTSEGASSGLSPEQKNRIAEKKAEAMQKLMMNKTAPKNMGVSWKKALMAEFSKDYFIKVKILALHKVL